MRISRKFVDSKFDIVNGMLGYDDPQWNTVGSLHLYNAYSAFGVHRVANESGGVDELLSLGTLREVSVFLSGMIAALRIERKA